MDNNEFHRLTLDLLRGHLRVNDNDYLTLKKYLQMDLEVNILYMKKYIEYYSYILTILYIDLN